ncbi:MAG: efflux RND transporter periplasmic adaptor subunit [Bacteroidales bacterium]|jgi:membrane fusion protein (multidrug efflux system)|nr:efflux RND transporter periplasmic adaptor subunit [Bacteroidales bacterium]
MRMEKKIVCFVVLCCLFSLHACKDFMRKEQATAITVEVMKVNTYSDTLYQNYIGKIEEEFSSSLSFSVPGNVEQVYVREGQYVEKGQLLASLNRENLQSTYEAALAMLKQAEDAYHRMEQLHKNGSVTELQWMDMLTQLEKAKSSANIAKKNLSAADLHAPFSGIIGKRNIEKGMYVMPTMQAISLLSNKNVNIKVAIPENIISSIYSGQKAIIRVAALNDRLYEGKVEKKGVVANPLSHSYEIIIPVSNKDKQLMPGMICNVKILVNDTIPYIVLPLQAVKLSHTGKHYVWLAKDSTAHKQYVVTGPLQKNGIVILDGLELNDLVITKGQQKVSEGSKIMIQ